MYRLIQYICIGGYRLFKYLKNNDGIMNSTHPIYTLKVASELSGTSVYSIRKYIDKGLLLPFKTATNRHLLSEVDIKRLICIRSYLDDMGLNVAGIKAQFALVPCWLIRPCSEVDRESCDAYTSASQPCWEVTNKGRHCIDEDCRICEVYKLPEKCSDLKSYLKNFELKQLT